jgi:hypothetical protein
MALFLMQSGFGSNRYARLEGYKQDPNEVMLKGPGLPPVRRISHGTIWLDSSAYGKPQQTCRVITVRARGDKITYLVVGHYAYA